MDYTHLRVSQQAGQAVRALTAIGTGLAMRKLSQSDALIAASKVVRDHPDEFSNALSEDET